MAEPLRCDFCKRTDGGPFAQVNGMTMPTGDDARICKRCCDERGIEVKWGPTYTFKVEP
jgi:hypothetical protein